MMNESVKCLISECDRWILNGGSYCSLHRESDLSVSRRIPRLNLMPTTIPTITPAETLQTTPNATKLTNPSPISMTTIVRAEYSDELLADSNQNENLLGRESSDLQYLKPLNFKPTFWPNWEISEKYVVQCLDCDALIDKNLFQPYCSSHNNRSRPQYYGPPPQYKEASTLYQCGLCKAHITQPNLLGPLIECPSCYDTAELTIFDYISKEQAEFCSL